MSIVYTPLRECVIISALSSVFEAGERKGYFSVSRDRRKIRYGTSAVTGDFTNPEERMRAEYYVYLLETRRCPMKRILLDMQLPLEDKVRFPNLVVFADDAKMEPYVIAEFKPAEMEKAERGQELKRTVYNAQMLDVPYVISFFGAERRVISVPAWDDEHPEKAEVGDFSL